MKVRIDFEDGSAKEIKCNEETQEENFVYYTVNQDEDKGIKQKVFTFPLRNIKCIEVEYEDDEV